jgi:hypothetical protein
LFFVCLLLFFFNLMPVTIGKHFVVTQNYNFTGNEFLFCPVTHWIRLAHQISCLRLTRGHFFHGFYFFYVFDPYKCINVKL